MKLQHLLLVSLLSVQTLFSAPTIDEKIASLVVLGFHGTKVTERSVIIKEVKAGLGGVIFFDQDPMNKMKRKNIVNAKQLTALTLALQKAGKGRLLICVDEEGGKVARLKARDGFKTFPSAESVAKEGDAEAHRYYSNMASMLAKNGINTNFAPSVDLLFSYNPIIAGKKRAFSEHPEVVSHFASIFVQEHRKQHVLTVIKHFPGHGSSKADSHKGFTDVTTTWSSKELEPFQNMIESQDVDMIMTAHIFNKNLDTQYPATLSYKTNTKLLRNQLHYEGVIITDDLQMAAIHKHYTLEETITLSLNSGVDILLFANQLAKPLHLQKIIDVVKAGVKKGTISQQRVDEAYHRVMALKDTLR